MLLMTPYVSVAVVVAVVAAAVAVVVVVATGSVEAVMWLEHVVRQQHDCKSWEGLGPL